MEKDGGNKRKEDTRKTIIKEKEKDEVKGDVYIRRMGMRTRKL